MTRLLVLVESPNKAKKIQGFLGREAVVRASVGHICDLPQKGYGVDLASFEESYELRNARVVSELRALLKGGTVDRVLLATDPDREGEAIAWHLARELKLKGTASQRVEFREITEKAIRAAIASPRPVDMARVDAQRARRVLDRIVGFDVSGEICWPAGATSAGRVQTPALHLLCERERQILAFDAKTYWTVQAAYGEGFSAFIPEGGGTAAGAVADAAVPDDGESGAELPDESAESNTGGDGAAAKTGGRLRARRFPTRAAAETMRDEAARHAHVVRDVVRRRTPKRPDPPYTTSTMQQDASRKLRLSAKQAADLAQQLFEAGYITYHRTDSVRVSEDAVAMARGHIARVAPDALPAEAPRQRAAKAGAQDAHEAIRPTKLDGDTAAPPAAERLYAMIKARFLAAQCKPALIDRTTLFIDAGPVPFAAEGATIAELGFLHFWRPYARQEGDELPAVTPGQTLLVNGFSVEEKQTAPPTRYDTGALIRKLEISGIGRPATFANIIETLLKRAYVHELAAGKGKKFLQPTVFGLQVDGLLTESFPELVSESYTAAMESELDRIEHADGETRVGYLRRWHGDFRAAMSRALPRASAYRVTHRLSARSIGGGGSGGARGEETSVTCDRCGEATYRKLARRKDKGSFLACPSCNMMRDVRARVKPGGCTRCGSALIEKRGKTKGVKFFGCVRYGAAERACDFIERDGATGPGAAVVSSSGVATVAAPARAASGAAGLAGTNERTLAAARAVSSAANTAATATIASAQTMPDHPRPTRTETDKQCPRCSAARLAVITPAGGDVTPYYACTDRLCGFTLLVGARRRLQPCPDCGAVVIERRRKAAVPGGPRGDGYWSCARYPVCNFRAAMASVPRVAPAPTASDTSAPAPGA